MTEWQADRFIGISRHRLTTDGRGVTTLAAFYGCPLRCAYCLNPHSWRKETKTQLYTPEELYRLVKIDQLYFLATDGGVTFGGGEPLLRPSFLAQFRALCGKEWHLCAETSLHVPWYAVEQTISCIDEWIIDIKDTDRQIYHRYTGGDSDLVMENLRRLARRVDPSRLVVRLPLIPSYNTEDDVEASARMLRALGITRLDRFIYQTEIHK